MAILRYLLLVVVGIVSVVASELLSIGALSSAPAGVDLTDAFFVTLVLPSIAIVALLVGLVLWKVFARLRWRGIVTYTASYAAAYTLVLSILSNPPADIATYVGIVLVACPVVLGGLAALFWKPAATAGAASR